MWNKEPSGEDYNRYIFLRDEDTCRFCESYKKSNDTGWSCYDLPNECNPHRGSDKRGLIQLYIDNSSNCPGGRKRIVLYEMIPCEKPWQEDEITITIKKGKYGHLNKEWLYAEDDPTLALSIKAEEAETIVKFIPLLKESGIDLEEILDIKGLTLLEDKELWIKSYHQFFGILRDLMNENAKVVPPAGDSPFLPLYMAMLGHDNFQRYNK